MIKISKKDILWNYFGTIFSVLVNVLVLPFILKFLTINELGLWYIFLSLSGIVQLIDFGFSPTIMRNIIYSYSGATKLETSGLSENFDRKEPNYSLLFGLLKASKSLYFKLSFFSFLILISGGSFYINYLLGGNLLIFPNYYVSWFIFIIATNLEIYFSFYPPALKGIGALKEYNIILIISKLFYIVLISVGLNFGGNLIFLTFSYLISVIIMKFLSNKYFFKRIYFKNDIKVHNTYSIKSILSTISPNAKKTGIVLVASWFILRSSTILSGYFFGIEETARFGLTLQLINLLGTFTTLLFYSYLPQITSQFATGNKEIAKKLFYRSLSFQWLTSIFGSIIIIIFARDVLTLINSQSTLLPNNLLIITLIIYILEWNHSTFANLITILNIVPFQKASILSAITIFSLSIILGYFTDLGILGLILSQGLVQLVYNNWYWPIFGSKIFSLTFKSYFKYLKSELYYLLCKFRIFFSLKKI